MASTSRTVLLACAVASACDTPEEEAFVVDGCDEDRVQLVAFDGLGGCTAEDPTGEPQEGRAPPVATEDWNRGTPAPRLQIAPGGNVSLAARCLDDEGLLVGWGCDDDRDGDLSIEVGPVCRQDCEAADASCPDGTLPWRGADGLLCVPACETCGQECTDDDCEDGQVCSGGVCVDDTTCEDVVCDEGEVCVEAECVAGTVDEDGDGSPASEDCDDRDPEVRTGSQRPCETGCGDGIATCVARDWICSAPEDCECSPDETRQEACGNCGQALRACGDDGLWEAALGPCEDEGECLPDGTDTEPCEESCSARTRTCEASCTWGPWGACGEAGACEPGESETEDCDDPCSERSRTCEDSCTWGAWGACTAGGVCEPGASEMEACAGTCSARVRTCEATCAWSTWGACGAGGICEPGTSEHRGCTCGADETRTCGADCTFGPWSGCTAGACTPGQTEDRACGNCGTESRSCTAACTWGAWGGCDGEGECDPAGGPIACACGGTRFCSDICELTPCQSPCECSGDSGGDGRTGCEADSYVYAAAACPAGCVEHLCMDFGGFCSWTIGNCVACP